MRNGGCFSQAKDDASHNEKQNDRDERVLEGFCHLCDQSSRQSGLHTGAQGAPAGSARGCEPPRRNILLRAQKGKTGSAGLPGPARWPSCETKPCDSAVEQASPLAPGSRFMTGHVSQPAARLTLPCPVLPRKRPVRLFSSQCERFFQKRGCGPSCGPSLGSGTKARPEWLRCPSFRSASRVPLACSHQSNRKMRPDSIPTRIHSPNGSH